MRKLALAAVALACLSAPALAGSVSANTDKPIVLAQSTTVITRDSGPSVRIQTGDRDRFERRGDRDRFERRHERRFMARDRDCRTVTIRERRGDRVIIKKIRRC
jgi:hypothetical protein